MKLKSTIVVLLFLLTTLISNAQNIENKIDSFIEETLNQFSEIPSLSITVVKDNQPIFTKTYGYTDVDNRIKSTTESAYYIASATKSFVGLVAAQLEEEGVLDLNTSISQFAPIKNFKDTSLFEGVTITDLLSHTSGIRNGLFTWRYASIGDYTTQDMIQILEEKTISLKNDKSYRYDNFGYNLLDLILSQEYGLAWKELLKDKIFKALDMPNTTAYISKAKKERWNIALPYTSINDKRKPQLALTQKNDMTFQAAGGMLMSIKDAQKWLLMNMNRGQLNGTQFFSETVVKKSHAIIADSKSNGDIFTNEGYGLGWNNAKFKDQKVLYHFGGFDGYFAHISFLPESNIGIAVFANESHFGDNVSNLIAAYIYDLLLGNVTQLSDYENEIEKVVNRVEDIQKNFEQDRLNRANRKWTLLHDLENYVGKYGNKYAGSINVETFDESLKVNLGISTAIASPSTKDDSIRVEFRNGHGSDILFISDNNGTMALVYGGNVYLKE
ncbi:serine hydrolase domain-containing protein [uncultured Croceitalea sp.]|uniref:serine hydrolase domain-containing protein n=1 Tax=uncultured Croceitalea sp. TaxID=1798908 RepID=UPI0033055F7B